MIWRKRIKVANRIKVAHQLTLTQITLDYPGEPSVITRLIVREGACRRIRVRVMQYEKDSLIAGSEEERRGPAAPKSR